MRIMIPAAAAALLLAGSAEAAPVNLPALQSTVKYSTTSTGAKEVGSGSINFGTMTGTGSISYRSGMFTGTGTADPEHYRMDVNGSFYGPAAQEVGGLFRITGNGGQGQGAIVGRQ